MKIKLILLAIVALTVGSFVVPSAARTPFIYYSHSGGHKGDPSYHYYGPSDPFSVPAHEDWVITVDVDCGHLPGVNQYAGVTVWDQTNGLLVVNNKVFTQDTYWSWTYRYQDTHDFLSVEVGSRNCLWDVSITASTSAPRT